MSQSEPNIEEFLKKCEAALPEYHQFVEAVYQGLKELEANEVVAIDLPEVAPRAVTTRSKSPVIASGKRVLIVDQAEINRVLIGRVFKGMPVQLEFSKDGVDAVTKCKQTDYDLVIMDLQMNGLNGSIATRSIRESNPRVFILGLTNQMPSDEEKNEAIQAGCNEYLGKERMKDTLLDKIMPCLQ